MSQEITFDQYERYGPYGSHGNEIGQDAIRLFSILSEVPTHDNPPYKWDKADYDAYHIFTELDTGLRFLEPSPEVEGDEIGDLHRAFERLHMALPFSEAERHWLRERPRRYEPDIAGAIWGQADEIMQDGLIRVVQGRELVRRWWAWRREVEEFAGQGALEETQQALGEIITTLVSDSNWPSGESEVKSRLLSVS